MENSKSTLIIGLGQTGLSVAKYLFKKNKSFYITDLSLFPSGLDTVKGFLDKKRILLGGFNLDLLKEIGEIIVSPGITQDNKIISRALSLNIPVITDFDIFFSESKSKIILVTGTNGKSTVVEMLEMILKLRHNKLSICAAGNIGLPVLDLLDKDPEISILEISSFQLALTRNIRSNISVLLNLDEDHLDWHESFHEYKKAKKKVFENTEISLYGTVGILEGRQGINISLFYEKFFRFISKRVNDLWTDHDKFNLMTVLVVCFFVERFENKNFSLDDKNDIEIFLEFLLKGLQNFKFLPHRFERLGILNGILYINDSKATNINSSIHAITSARKLYPDQEIILICGGDSKGQNFAEFANICGESIKRIYLIGKDSYKLYKILNSKVSCVEVSNLADALAQAKNFAESRNIILLSPACSSKDMFIDYIDRGQQFKELLGII